MSIEILERDSAIDVLLYVLNHPDCSKSEVIKDDVTRIRSRFARMHDLIGCGLLEESGKHNLTLSLTPLGENVASRLSEIVDLMESVGE